MDYLAGRRHTDTEEEDDEIEALKLEGLRSEELPLFKRAAGSDEASEPSEAQSDGEQREQWERKRNPKRGKAFREPMLFPLSFTKWEHWEQIKAPAPVAQTGGTPSPPGFS